MSSKPEINIPKEIIIWGTFGQVLLNRDVIEQYGIKIIAVFAVDETHKAPLPDVPIYYGLDGLKSWTKDRDAHYLTQHPESSILSSLAQTLMLIIFSFLVTAFQS